MELLAFQFIVLLYVLFRSVDLLISAIVVRSWARVVAYGLVAVLAFLAELIGLGLHI
jgi:hypothetical protein